jgi:hypothetical protein
MNGKWILGLAVCVVIAAAPASAQQTMTHGWEDGTSTIIGQYSDIDAYNVGAPDPVHTGSRSLRLVDQAASGTPQAFIAWITNLADGDVVDASFWRYDDTPGASPSCRIWAHYNDDPIDVNGYSGSASGNYDYGPGTGWDQVGHSWTMADGHTGLVIEVRTYSNPGDTVWIDDLEVTIPDTAVFEDIVPVELQSLTVE